MRSLRAALAALLLVTFSTSSLGCFASFRLVNKVYELNKKVGGKVVQELVFLVFIILPVYDLAALADAIVFNTIEFWTGSNVLSMRDGEKQDRSFDADGKKVRLSFADHGRSMTIEVAEAGRAPRILRVRVDEAGARLTDERGRVLAQSGSDAAGGLVVRDGSGETLATRTVAERAKLEAAVQAGPAALIEAAALPVADRCELAFAR